MNKDMKDYFVCNDCKISFLTKSAIVNHQKNGCYTLRKGLVKYCPNLNNNPKCSIIVKGNKTCKSCSLFGRTRPEEVRKKLRTLSEKDRLDFAQYRSLVSRYTRQNELSKLFGFEFRGRSTANCWQLDHIITVKYGYDNNILASLIGSIENIRFIPWRLNRSKWDNITSYDNYDTSQNRKAFELLIKWFGFPKLKRI